MLTILITVLVLTDILIPLAVLGGLTGIVPVVVSLLPLLRLRLPIITKYRLNR